MNQKLITNKCHISVSAMKLLIVLTFCLGFVVCRDTVLINYPPSVPLDSGSVHSAPFEIISPPSPDIHVESMFPPSPEIHVSEAEVPLSEYIDFINEESEEDPSTGYKNSDN